MMRKILWIRVEEDKIKKHKRKDSELKVLRFIRDLQFSFNPEATDIIDFIHHRSEMIIERFKFSFFVNDIQKKAANFKEA
jgi:hypothetical protein